jgi:hypothetical protein
MFCWADPFGSGRSSSACRSQTVPAPTRPEALRLSGGYVGAKRVIWQMAHNANSVAKERGLDVHFQVLLPLQLVGDTCGCRKLDSAILVMKSAKNRL